MVFVSTKRDSHAWIASRSVVGGNLRARCHGPIQPCAAVQLGWNDERFEGCRLCSAVQCMLRWGRKQRALELRSFLQPRINAARRDLEIVVLPKNQDQRNM